MVRKRARAGTLLSYYKPNPFKNGQVYSFKRSYVTSMQITMSVGVSTESHGSFSFKLSDLASSADFTGLFDRYRLTKVRMRFIPRISQQSVAGAQVATTQESPPIITVIDYDDAATTADYTTLVQYENATVHQAFKPFTVIIRPRFAVAAYGAGVFTSYANMSDKTWLDVASPDIQYYGLKWATTVYSNTNSGNQYYDVFMDYYLQFKNPR